MELNILSQNMLAREEMGQPVLLSHFVTLMVPAPAAAHAAPSAAAPASRPGEDPPARLGRVGDGGPLGRRLEHDGADAVDAGGDGAPLAADGHRALCAVR